jgi:hypothetical protein
MHLLFYGREQTEIVESKRVENLLRAQSVKVIFQMFTNHEPQECIVLFYPNFGRQC